MFEARQQLIGCLFGVWLVFFGHTVKVLTLTTIGTVAAVLAFSTGCSQSKIEELNTQLDDTYTNLVHTEQQLTKAKRAQKEAEREMTVAQDQSETAYVNLHKVQRQLTEQKKRADQFAEENQELRVITLNQPAQEKRIAQLEAASKALNTSYDLSLAEYKTFMGKAAQALAAKDKKISELNAELSAAQNKN